MNILARLRDWLLYSPPIPPQFREPNDPHMVFVSVPPDRMPNPDLTEHDPALRLLLQRLRLVSKELGTVSATVLHGELTIQCTGPDADKLFDAVKPVLRDSLLLPKAYVLLRYGGIGAREVQVSL